MSTVYKIDIFDSIIAALDENVSDIVERRGFYAFLFDALEVDEKELEEFLGNDVAFDYVYNEYFEIDQDYEEDDEDEFFFSKDWSEDDE
jgi:hypothetical protein